jgi:hypothetical protein
MLATRRNDIESYIAPMANALDAQPKDRPRANRGLGCGNDNTGVARRTGRTVCPFAGISDYFFEIA